MLPTIYAQPTEEQERRTEDAFARSGAPSTAQLLRVERALDVLLSPFDEGSWDEWRDGAHRALHDLLGDDYLLLLLPSLSADVDDDTRAIYEAFSLPVGTAGVRRDDRIGSHGRIDPARRTLVRMVSPALRSALLTWRQLRVRRQELGRVLDTAGSSTLLFDTRGAVLHENAAFARLIGDESPHDVVRLREAARVLASGIGARRVRADRAAMSTSIVRTVQARWELTATHSSALLGAAPVICVAIRRQASTPLTNDDLRQKFGLTAREVEVARLVGEGLSNQEMAARLRVSFFTARNHVERVLNKLGVGNRARVGTLLRAEAA